MVLGVLVEVVLDLRGGRVRFAWPHPALGPIRASLGQPGAPRMQIDWPLSFLEW